MFDLNMKQYSAQCHVLIGPQTHTHTHTVFRSIGTGWLMVNWPNQFFVCVVDKGQCLTINRLSPRNGGQQQQQQRHQQERSVS